MIPPVRKDDRAIFPFPLYNLFPFSIQDYTTKKDKPTSKTEIGLWSEWKDSNPAHKKSSTLLDGGQTSLPFEFYKKGCPMVTYEALFQYTLVIIGIITLIITVNKKK